MASPYKLSAAELKLRGSWRAGERAEEERFSGFVRGIPEMPKWLSDVAKQEWNRIVPLLFDTGVLAEVDGGALAVYCATHALSRTVYQQMEKLPEGGEARNKMVRVWLGLCETLLRISAQFGMTPLSRRNVRVLPGGEDQPDEFQKFLASDRWPDESKAKKPTRKAKSAKKPK